MKPLVTIITPTYNRADFLPETVESVLNQDYPNLEYIVLDDGSKDETAKVIASYQDRLTYLYHDNMGETATVNKGFELAKGDIICVVNSDDPLFSDRAVSIAVEHLEAQPDALMAYPDWVLIDDKGAVLSRRELPQYTIETMITKRNVELGPGMFIRKSTILKIGPRDSSIKYVGDLDYSFRIASIGKILHIPHFLATHRVHQSSLSVSAKGPRMAQEVLSLGLKYIDAPSFPEHLRKNRHRILARWHLMSIYYLGYANFSLMTARVKDALRLSPLATFQTAVLFTLKKMKWLALKLFPARQANH